MSHKDIDHSLNVLRAFEREHSQNVLIFHLVCERMPLALKDDKYCYRGHARNTFFILYYE